MATVYETFSPSAAPPRRSGWPLIREFYSDRRAWVVLVVTSLFTAYIGGAVMFWTHAIWLKETGPDIPNVAHWLLDSTSGFFGLTPALALILPFAAQTTRQWRYVVTTGTAFALITVPGPIFHDMLVARGTWVADQVTTMMGGQTGPLDEPDKVSVFASIGWQFAIGLPTYILAVALATAVLRAAQRS